MNKNKMKKKISHQFSGLNSKLLQTEIKDFYS